MDMKTHLRIRSGLDPNTNKWMELFRSEILCLLHKSVSFKKLEMEATEMDRADTMT